jgi:hypothetical protein
LKGVHVQHTVHKTVIVFVPFNGRRAQTAIIIFTAIQFAIANLPDLRHPAEYEFIRVVTIKGIVHVAKWCGTDGQRKE